MSILKDKNLFSFNYDGKSIWDYKYIKSVEENGDELVTTYVFEDCLKVTNVARTYTKYGAYEWVNYFENTSNENTKIISELWDCDCNFEIGHLNPHVEIAWEQGFDEITKIYTPMGSVSGDDDFKTDVYKSYESRYAKGMFVGDTKSFEARSGRSSDGDTAPFFNVHHNNRGVVFAIGWTGRWKCDITRDEETVNIKSKVYDTNFVLFPNEKIRTSSVVVMPYEGTFISSQNKWRRFIKNELSTFTKRIENLPFTGSVWGGMKSKYVIDRINTYVENEIPIEYIWMDAGWYGANTNPSASEFGGDWPQHTGDWVISPLIHPDNMQDVSETIQKNNLKFLLWLEPERVRNGVPILKEHPEYFLYAENKDWDSSLLNLGSRDAYNYCLETITNLIKYLKLDCYRQDFNFNPSPFWEKNDTEDRKGISEIKHIMGLYELWDTLLERFPDLIIDNCASGGRRIDIETLKRSMPLCRSDAQCSADFEAERSQIHTMNFGLWMPFSGSFTGRVYDTYRLRNEYCGGLRLSFSFSADDDFGNDKEKMLWLKNISEEYLRVRPYFYADYYPLTDAVMDHKAWNVVQWDRPENNDGLIQVFKHKESPFVSASFELGNIDVTKNYKFEDADGGSFIISGKELAEDGFNVTIKEKRVAKLYFYSKL